MKQTINNSMNPINQSCPSTFKDYIRFSVLNAPNDYRIPYLQGSDYAQRGLGETTGTWNNDNVNAQQTKQLYGDVSYPYFNRDSYNGKYDEIINIRDLYEEKGKVELSELQKNKNSIYSQKYRK